MNPEATSKSEAFGPSAYFVPGAALTSPLFWIGIALATFRFSPAFRVWVWKVASVGPLQNQVVAFYEWMKHAPVPVWSVFFGLAFFYGIVRWGTSSYRVTADGNLIVNTGLLGWRTPRGPATEYQDTIALATIADVNISRNPIQFLCGTGSLDITFGELSAAGYGRVGRTIRLNYIAEPERIRDLLMGASQIHNAHFIM